MMPRDPRQLVNVSLTLIGLQDTGVAAHRPDSDCAAVSVRVGGALVYMHDRMTARNFGDVWRLAEESSLLLPREPRSAGNSDSGAREPTVMIEASDTPTAFSTLLREPGRPSRLRVVLGRLVFDVRDLGAYRSTTAAFHRAADVAEEIFLDGRGAGRARLGAAAKLGGRAFISPVGSSYQRAVRYRTGAVPGRETPSRSAERGPAR